MPSKIEIPVLDCDEIVGCLEDIQDTEKFRNFAHKLGNGMKDIGFVYLINHDTELIQTVERFHFQCRQFFALPTDQKSKSRIKNSIMHFNGYNSTGDEKKGEINTSDNAPLDLKECLDFHWMPGLQNAGPCNPVEVPGLTSSVECFGQSLTKLAKRLCVCFAIILDLDDKDYFIKRHRALEDASIKGHSGIRNNFYYSLDSPPTNAKSEIIRLGEHCDWGIMTLLFQDDVGGLEAKMPSGDWIPVRPIKGSIVLNAGLALEKWSGGHLPATPHRVKAIGSNQCESYRQSAVFFIQPDGPTRCNTIVPEKKGWIPTFPNIGNETYSDYFLDRIRQTRDVY